MILPNVRYLLSKRRKTAGYNKNDSFIYLQQDHPQIKYDMKWKLSEVYKPVNMKIVKILNERCNLLGKTTVLLKNCSLQNEKILPKFTLTQNVFRLISCRPFTCTAYHYQKADFLSINMKFNPRPLGS